MAQQWNLERVRDMWQRGSRRHTVSFLDPFGATPHGFTHTLTIQCVIITAALIQFHRRLQASRETAWCCGLSSEKWRVRSCTGVKYPWGVVEMKSLWQPTSYELLPCPKPYWAWPSASNNSRSGLLQQMLPWQSTEWKNNTVVMFLTKSFKLSICSYCNSMCIYNLLQHLCFGNKRKKKNNDLCQEIQCLKYRS